MNRPFPLLACLALAAAGAAGCDPIAPADPPSNGGGGTSSLAPNQLSSADALARIRNETDRYWLGAKEEAYEASEAVLAKHTSDLAAGRGLLKIVHGSTSRPEITLTFDDGPHPAFTPQLLDVLKRENVKATFFVVGSMAEKYPELIRRMVAEGHTVGNHTYHHVSLPKIPLSYVADEIQACGEVIRSITGKPPHLFRPPGGKYTNDTALVARLLGYTTVLWTADPGDYASPGASIVLDRTIAGTRNGGIILLHDGIQQTIDTLPSLIRRLRAKGFTFVSTDRLIEDAYTAGQKNLKGHHTLPPG